MKRRWIFGLRRKPCMEIEALFYWGPQQCGTPTRRRSKDIDGDIYPDCGAHDSNEEPT